MSSSATLVNSNFISTFLTINCTWIPWSSQLGDRRPNSVLQQPGEKSAYPLAVGLWTIHGLADPARVSSPLGLLEELS